MGESFGGPGLGLGEPTPEGKRPYGWLASVIGIGIWVMVLGLSVLLAVLFG